MGETLLEKSRPRCQAHSLGRGVGVAGRCRTCFPTERFGSATSTPTWTWRVWVEAESRPHSLEDILIRLKSRVRCLCLRGPGTGVCASEVTSGVGEARARQGAWELTLYFPNQREGTVPSLAGRAPDQGTTLEGLPGI